MRSLVLYNHSRYSCTCMAKNEIDSVSASDFRSHLFEHLGAAANGHVVRIHYKGNEYQLAAVKPEGKLERFYTSGSPEPVIVPGDELFSDDPSLKEQREKEWVAKWNRRLKRK